MSSSPEDNLLARIFAIKSGSSSFGREEQSAFCKDLIGFRSVLIREGVDAVTIPAIRGWFDIHGTGRGSPKRDASLGFLYEYLKWMEKTFPQAAADRREDFDQVYKYLQAASIRNDSLARQKEFASKVSRVGGRWSYSREIVRSITGVYQVIRPYASVDQSNERYILEAMEIELERNNIDPTILMYSHTIPKREFLYKGDLGVRNRYCFSLLNRSHETNRDEIASRCIGFYIGHNLVEDRDRFVGHCISGIVLRGASGLHVGKMAMALPFIAIHADDSVCGLKSAEIVSTSKPNIHRLTPASSILIGSVSEKEASLFGFCSTLFDALKRDFLAGLTLHTLPPGGIEAIISADGKSDRNAFEAWREVAATVPDRPANLPRSLI